MVKIRFARFGSRGNPYYHIVVTDSQSRRDGRFIEQIGTYDPAKPFTDAKLDRERLDHWVGEGAQLTTTLKKLVREQTKAAG